MIASFVTEKKLNFILENKVSFHLLRLATAKDVIFIFID